MPQTKAKVTMTSTMARRRFIFPIGHGLRALNEPFKAKITGIQMAHDGADSKLPSSFAPAGEEQSPADKGFSCESDLAEI